MISVDFAINGGCNIGNEALRDLAQLPDLEILELSNNSGITDEGLKHVSTLKKLRSLYLYQTAVRGPGLRHVAHLPRLEHLQLGTSLTDEGVAHLQGFQSLKTLSLIGTLVSGKTSRELRAALPLCEIID